MYGWRKWLRPEEPRLNFILFGGRRTRKDSIVRLVRWRRQLYARRCTAEVCFNQKKKTGKPSFAVRRSSSGTRVAQRCLPRREETSRKWPGAVGGMASQNGPYQSFVSCGYGR